jgi:hypothetical protein
VWLWGTVEKYVLLLMKLGWRSNSLDELLSCLWIGSSGLAGRHCHMLLLYFTTNTMSVGDPTMCSTFFV